MTANKGLGLLLGGVALTLLVYWPGLEGGFVFDDGINIVENTKVHLETFSYGALIAAAGSYGTSITGRQLSMLSFALNHLAAGLDPYFYKLTNLVIHVFVGLSLAYLCRLILQAGARQKKVAEPTGTSQQLICSAVAAAWLLHPINLTGVLYVVQRMTSLSALFSVFGMILYLIGRVRQIDGRPNGAPLILAAILFCGPLALFSKENGALLPLLLFLIEWCFLGFSAPDRKNRRLIRALHVVLVLIPALAIILFLLFRSDWLISSYAYRSFTLSERLLTEGRVLWFYIRLILLPSIEEMGLYHDDFELSSSWVEPISTIFAEIGILILLITAVALRKKAPVLSFGILFFFVGHSMESTVLSLEIAHEHRNYLPSFGLLLLLCYYFARIPKRFPQFKSLQPFVASAFVMTLAASTAARASQWGNDVERAAMDVRHHPLSARSHNELAYSYLIFADYAKNPSNFIEKARQEYMEVMRFDNYTLTAHLALVAMDSKEGRTTSVDLLNVITDRLAGRPLAPATNNALIRLSQCQLKNTCHVPTEVLFALFDAVLKNKNLQGFTRSQILTEILQHELARGNLNAALSFAEAAVDQYPADPQLHLNFAHLLINAGDRTRAVLQIESASELDSHGFYSERISEQRRLLVSSD